MPLCGGCTPQPWGPNHPHYPSLPGVACPRSPRNLEEPRSPGRGDERRCVHGQSADRPFGAGPSSNTPKYKHTHTPRKQHLTQNYTASFLLIQGDDIPLAVITLILTLAGDIESNPGPPKQLYMCPNCKTRVTSARAQGGSVCCTKCGYWFHLACTTLKTLKDYTNTWTCTPCTTYHTSITQNINTQSTSIPPITRSNSPTPPQMSPLTQTPPLPHTSPSPYTLPPTYTPPPPHTPPPDHTYPLPQSPQVQTPPPHNTNTHNINILQYNADGLTNKIMELKEFINKHNIHIATIQETKLQAKNKTPKIPHYTPLRLDRTGAQGGGLITYIHQSISYTDITQQTQTLITPDNITEIQAIKIKTGKNRSTNIVNLYIPPNSSPQIPINYSPNLQNLCTLPDTIIGGDFNAKDTSWYTQNIQNTRGQIIATQFNTHFILNNTEQHTHIPHQAGYSVSSPDITFCSPSLATNTTWTTVKQLSSDHLPIIITTNTTIDPNVNRDKTFTNYNKANWERFTQDTEQEFIQLNNHQISDIDKTLKRFNKIINNADKKYIPKGNTKKYNPNFTSEIANLIRQRDNLKHNTQLPHSIQTVTQIQALNNTIITKINDKQKENFQEYLKTLNHTTNTGRLYKTINSITNSNIGITPSHAAITNNDNIPSHTEQANILMEHYANISHLKPIRADRRIKRRIKTFKLDTTIKPFLPAHTANIIKKLKNSKAIGVDNISNIHLKHLGPQGITALTNISNYSYQHCKIPNLWKQGKIITLLKPNKNPTEASSHRPVTLLCTPSKVTERLILDIANPDIPLANTQHGFRPCHSTTTLLTNLTQQTFDGMNSRKPAQRTLLATIDISKAFDAIPRFLLTNKILDTNMHNNTKRWLSNYLAGRQAHVTFNGKKSKTKNIPNGVPQGSVLSPTLFNLYMHDIPTPTDANVHLASYADDITITSTHNNTDIASTKLQTYLNIIQTWLTNNRLKVAPTKSTITLLTNDNKEHKKRPHITLNNIPIPHTHSTKILGVTYNTSTSFANHITNIKNKCTPRLNALRALAGTNFGHQNETTTLVYKQFIRSVINYASPSWAPNLSNTHHQTLQKIQNSALRIITGCTQTSPIEHLHAETKVLKVRDHLDMRGTQFIASAHNNPHHPCHYMYNHTDTPRHIKITPERQYNNIYNSLPPLPNATSYKQHIHKHLTEHAINRLGPNSLLGVKPPPIDHSELQLDRSSRVDLSRLRCGHHPSLLSYKHRLDETIDDTCNLCKTEPHTIQHIMTHCPSLSQQRQQHNISGVMDLWSAPVESVGYLRAASLLSQSR